MWIGCPSVAPFSGNKSMTKNILVVDDEESIRDMMSLLLLDTGYEVLTASNGKEALEILNLVHTDLIITDIIMPDMEGLEFIRRVKRERKLSTKIIAMSGSGQDYLNLALMLGANFTIQKPFDITHMLNAIQNI